jgi:hypothetical protein
MTNAVTCTRGRIHGEDGEDIGPLRVWLQHAWMPGLAMTRALGDGLARRC